MTTVLLVRHGHHIRGGGTIAGRLPDVHLSPDGIKQCEGLAARLAAAPITAIYCSPLDRTRETAQFIADAVGVPLTRSDEILELDFGDWMGARLDDLRSDERWQHFNRFRSGTQMPNGEWMFETQTRIVRFMLQLRERHPGEHVALVSHGDVIKSAIAYFLGVSLDQFLRIEISPASVSVVQLADWGPFVLCVNETGGLPPLP